MLFTLVDICSQRALASEANANINWTVLGAQRELWELSVLGDIPMRSVMKVIGRTATVRYRTRAYGGAELKITVFVRSRNNYFHIAHKKILAIQGFGENRIHIHVI